MTIWVIKGYLSVNMVLFRAILVPQMVHFQIFVIWIVSLCNMYSRICALFAIAVTPTGVSANNRRGTYQCYKKARFDRPVHRTSYRHLHVVYGCLYYNRVLDIILMIYLLWSYTCIIRFTFITNIFKHNLGITLFECFAFILEKGG